MRIETPRMKNSGNEKLEITKINSNGKTLK